MIEVEIPVDKIPYIRIIEGRKFKDGKWLFPTTASLKLKELGLIDESYHVEEKKFIEYELSSHLYKYQKDIINKALNYDGYGIFSDTGTGKCNIGLEIAQHLGKTLILCPLSVIETAWIDDCNRFYPHLKILNCHGNSKKERLNKLHTDADIYVMNYDSFKIVKNELQKMKLQCMIVDESSVMKNMKSQITLDILSMVDFIPRRYVLSGTPTPNHNLEIFPQMKFVNNDIFGNNFLGFQATYFHQNLENPHIWYQTQDDKDRFYNRLSDGSVFLKKEDCIDLPEKVFEVRQVDLLCEQRRIYDHMLQDIKDNINNWSKFEFTAKLMKLREVVSGFVINKDQTITDFDTNKEIVLKNAIEEIGNKPIIIWCQFIHEIERLADKFNGVALTSKTKNRDEIIRQFQNNQIPLLFAHPQILGKGLTFTNCNYNIYYSLSFSFEEFKQSQDRIHRIGQNNKCTYIILQGKDTIDEKIYNCLKRKGNAVDELYLEMGLKR